MSAANLRCAQRGVAIVAVMWMIAALSLLLLGVAATTREDVRASQWARASAEAAAWGDAAIQLAVLEMRTTPEPVRRLVKAQYAFEGHAVEVSITPAGGFIDLNTAPETLLRDLFVYGADVPPDAAEMLAQHVLDWRDADQSTLPLGAEDAEYEAAGVRFRTRGAPFEGPEDLLQVLGIDYELYDRVLPFVTVSGSALVDPQAAPIGVLAILAKGDLAAAQRIAAARDASDPVIDLTALEQTHVGVSAGSVYRLAATIESQGRTMTRVRWIDVGQAAANGLPWRTLRIEPPRAGDQVVGAASVVTGS